VIRKRLFANVYGRIDRSTRRATSRLRSELVGDLEGDVLEIGCGPGANFAHYGPAARVTATDYSDHMLARARAEAALESRADSITVEHAEAGGLGYPDESFDAVVSTLVLCSVGDLEATLAEIRRVLRPGGELRLWEHVRSDRRLVALGQTVVTPVYSPFADGCHLNRDTASAVRDAGFEVLEESHPKVRGHPLPNLVMRAKKPARASDGGG
jgi:ubiquinone/menaquinone biosynthesis C-methylase UbiE